jgi:hypothetical protein
VNIIDSKFNFTPSFWKYPNELVLKNNTYYKIALLGRHAIILTMFFSSISVYSQKDSLREKEGLAKRFLNKWLNEEGDGSEVFFYPTLAYTPETSWEFGASALKLYRAKNDSTNRLSEIQSFGFITLNEQYGGFLEHFLYSDKDKWFFLGKLKAQRFPLQYYGVGIDALKANEQLIGADYIAIRERVLRRISNNFFGGLEIDFQRVSNTSIEGLSELPSSIPGIGGSRNLGLGLGLVYDSRHNALNVRDGFFAEVALLNYGKSFGNDFVFSSSNLDLRYFKSVRKNQVLAAQIYGQSVNGSPPFNMMALLGSEGMMRGYYYGRFRDKHYLAAQVEYRFLPFDFSKRIGGVAFLSAGSVQPQILDFNFKEFLPAGGLGLRFLIFPKKDIFIRFDVGFTKEGKAFYIYTGEAF